MSLMSDGNRVTDFNGVNVDKGLYVGGTQVIDDNGELAAAAVTPAMTNVVQAVTATDTGATTGTIADTTTFAVVDADSDANHIVVLPTPTPGRIVWLSEDGTTGFELRSSAPTTVSINGGSGANAETAIAATDVLVRAVCKSATQWIVTCFAANGTESAADAAA